MIRLFTIICLIFVVISLPAQIIPDTVFSSSITTHTKIDGFNLPEAFIRYRLIDSINNIITSVDSGYTQESGIYLVDSLPILQYTTNIGDYRNSSNHIEILITGSGTSSLHTFIAYGIKKSTIQGCIYDLYGNLIKTLTLKYNPITQNHEAFWDGKNSNPGIYIFSIHEKSILKSKKFFHNRSNTTTTYIKPKIPFKSTEKVFVIANSKYTRTITSPFTEAYQDTVYVHEDMTHYFEAELEHLPINPTSIDGTILVNGQFPAYNANIHIKNLTDEGITFTIETDENGNYNQDDMPVPIDAIFSNPEDTQYEVTTTAQNPNNFEQKVDTVDMVSGENFIHDINVTANPIAPGSLSGTILVNNQFPAYNANIHVENTNNPSINFDFQTDANGDFSQEDIPVPLDALFTNPETSDYQITVQAQDPNNWQEQTDDIVITSGQNLDLDINVTANPIDPAEVSGQVLLNGEDPIENANLHWKNLSDPSTTYDFTTNAQGEYDEDVSVPLDALFTNPEDTEYEVTTTGANLETKIDTFLVISGQQNTNNILVFPTQYANGNVQALLRYSDDNQGVGFADVEYKQLENQSQIFTTQTSTNGAYTLEIPVVYEPVNPGQTAYIITYSPSQNTSPPFFTKIDTILISPGTNSFIHYVEKNIIEPTQDIEGVVRDAYTKTLASGITVRLIDRTNGQVIEEDVTGPDGKYSFEDLAQGSEVEFELGSDNHFWSYNNEYDVPLVIGDTLITFNRLAYPKQVQVPVNGVNYTISGEGEEVSEMVGTDKVNFEEILRHEDNMHPTDPFNQGYLLALEYITDSIYEGNSPITTVSTPRDITGDMQATYDPYTNFFPGLLGWNVDFGGGNVTTPIWIPTPYGVTATLGGEIETTGQLSSFIKELEGRRLSLGDVTGPAQGGRESMMNQTATMPTEKDRAYIKLILLNQKARFDSGEETYSLEYLTDDDPNSDKSSNSSYKDIPGTKPHFKEMLDQSKVFNYISN